MNGKLDRETKSHYVIEIQAADQGKPSRSATMKLTVNITDDNDNDPVFARSRLEHAVPEDAEIGRSLVKVSATDKDQGLNAAIRYYVTDGDPNQDFKMDEYSGELRVNKRLDHERQNKYYLTVHAEDNGRKPRHDTATVTIRILDINDCEPRFVDSPYTAFVQENMAAVPVHVLKVSARDDDSTDNSRLSYVIRRGDGGVFDIGQTSGVISAKVPLDREKTDKYELTIVAFDSGEIFSFLRTTISVFFQNILPEIWGVIIGGFYENLNIFSQDCFEKNTFDPPIASRRAL